MPRMSRRAQKELSNLPGPLREKAEELMRRLDDEPALGKKLLGGLKDLRSARLGRTHRIIYKVSDEGVAVVTIAPRKDSYK